MILCQLSFINSQIPITSNYGREFIVVFPPNENNIIKSSDLWLYISSVEKDSNIVGINYLHNGNEVYEEYVANVGKVTEVSLPSSLEFRITDKFENKSIKINSKYDITLFALSNNLYTADAYICLPMHILDTSYIVSSWKNSITGFSNNRFSSAIITGLDDHTKVTVHPSTPIRFKNSLENNKFDFIINNGESAIIEADYKSDLDVTSTIITSNKPIYVLSTHQRAAIPTNGNRDVLIAQSPPISILGTNYCITPIKFPDFLDFIICRISPAFDSTRVTTNSIDTILNKFEYLELNTDQALSLKSDKPIQCSQYSKSTFGMENPGDPFIAIQAPIEQYLNNYTFISAPFEEFTEHWVNVTIHKNGINTLVLDGFPIDTILFKNISGTEYFWASISLNEGSHRIKSDSTFGILAYGYGPAISYGYTGGMKTERLLEKIMDSNLPELQSKVNCNTEITVTELNEYDSGLDKITVAESKNVNVEIKPFQKGDKTANINLSLQNPKDDGFAILNTKDVKGFERDDTVSLGGFNISSDFISYHDSISYLGFRCDTIRLKNNGKYSSTFNLYFDKNTKISVPPHFGRITLTSGQDTAIPFCVYADSPKSIEDIFTIQDDCERKNTYNVIYTIQELGTDINSKCDVELELIITLDLKSYFWGNDIKPESLMKVYNLEGAKVYSGNLMNLLDNFSKGIYFIHIFENDILTGRYVVNVD